MMTAPSFSSFPPVFDSFPDLEQSSSSHPRSTEEAQGSRHSKHNERKHGSKREREDKEEKVRKHDQGKHEKKKERRHGVDDREVDRLERKRSSKHRKRRSASREDKGVHVKESTATQESFNRIFFLDRKGDELNIVYGSLHAGDIPKYRHVGHGKRVLGLQPNLAVVYRGSKGVEIGEAGWHGRAPQLTDSRARALLGSGQTRRLTASSKTLVKYEEADGFIRVRSGKGKEKEQEYRSISIALDEKEDSDISSHSDSESSGDDSDTSPLSAREESIRSLEQLLTTDPTSESNWILLVQHSVGSPVSSKKNEERVRAEISVSILERALSAHPSNNRSLLLRLKYLRAGESVWDIERMKKEWDKALEDIRSADLIVEWLDWAMRTSSGLDSVIEDAIRATQLVGSSGAGEDGDRARIRVLWRIATFFRQAGYVERGFALFQAQTELSFNIPDDDKRRPFSEQLDALEEFWESEAPRAGESGAKGWKTWKRYKEAENGRNPRRVNVRDDINPYTAWHHAEAESDRRLIFPARMPSDEGDDNAEEADEDPYSTILFSDIRPFLTDLRTSRGRDLLRLVWLAYLGLHIPGLSSAFSSTPVSSDDRWADAYFLQPTFLQFLFPRSINLRMITTDSYAGVSVGREKNYAKSFSAVKSWSLDLLEPLEGLTVNGEFRVWIKGSLSGIDPEIINVMRRLIKDFRQNNVLELAFEAAVSSDERVLKHSQALLSENSSSAELLASHAYLERIRRKYDKARKVYRVSIQSLAQNGGPSMVYLWWGSAEMEWLLSKGEAALEVVLLAAGQPNERTNVKVLRAKRRLEELCQPNITPEWRFRLKWIKLRILLDLLVGTLEMAIEVSERMLAAEEVGSLSHESLAVAALIMVYHHTVTLRNRASPAILRGLVQKALNIYPSNSIIIGLFLECEKGEGVWGRVREFLRESSPGTLRGKSVARRLIEVWIANWEEGRWPGEIERVRAGLEAAVTSDRTKGSAILWKVYVKFEIAAGNIKRAKAVLFRALKECPMVKELYLLAFDDDLRHAYSRRELMDLSDTMAERGIRLRRSLAEFLEEHKRESDGERSGTDQSGDENMDEQEYESKELRRLMPY